MTCRSCGKETTDDARFCPQCATGLTSPSQGATPVERSPRSPHRFVGRQREMAELRQALEDTLSGQGRVFLLAGNPGIGKTRTAQELARNAAESGMLPTWGRCYDGEGAPPIGPGYSCCGPFSSRPVRIGWLS
jgi:predicted ATP-dependent serine protease